MLRGVNLLFIISLGYYPVNGQELEPRLYANLPKDLNALAVVYGISKGNLLTDPSLPIEDLRITSQNAGLGYVRTFGLINRLSRIQVSIPFLYITGKLNLNGRDTTGSRSGFGDIRLRMGMNFSGSPAVSKKDFVRFQQKTIIGITLVTSIPTGTYHQEKLINTGSHRWAFKPEIGISKRFKHVYAEAYMGIWFYTNNTTYLVSKTLKQDPVYSVQAHTCYYFKNQMWISADGNWFNGGETFVDNVPRGDLKDNWRAGAAWSVPLAPKHSLKLQFHTGVYTKSNYHYKTLVLSYQFIF